MAQAQTQVRDWVRVQGGKQRQALSKAAAMARAQTQVRTSAQVRELAQATPADSPSEEGPQLRNLRLNSLQFSQSFAWPVYRVSLFEPSQMIGTTTVLKRRHHRRKIRQAPEKS